MKYTITLKLMSDTTFGNGDGVSGLIDTEVEHDRTTGLPYIPARRLRGLLIEECSNILFALHSSGNPNYHEVQLAAERFFGSPGSTHQSSGAVFIGNATLPDDFVNAVSYEVASKTITKDEVLSAFTTIRRQTAIDPVEGVAKPSSLRAERAVISQTQFKAVLEVQLSDPISHLEEALLAACVMSVRRGGHGRNRGRGRLLATLSRDDTNITPQALFLEKTK